jgi:hypothetical protein
MGSDLLGSLPSPPTRIEKFFFEAARAVPSPLNLSGLFDQVTFPVGR